MQYISVKTFDSYITANIWLSKLQDQGISCYLKDQFTVTIDPILSNAIGGIKLCVNDSQLERAKDLIAQFEEENKQTQKCPNCGSLNVQYVSQPGNPTNWLSAIGFWMFGSYAISAKQVYHCYDCGYEFDELEPVDIENK